MQHTLGHIDCPACMNQAFVAGITLSTAMLYPEAAAKWIESREFHGGDGRARYLRRHSLRDLRDYDRPLARFFGRLRLEQIHLGHLRQYQHERAAGLLGPTREDLTALYLTRVARSLRQPKEEVIANPQAFALVTAQVDAYPPRLVSPNKINQELGMLACMLRAAGAWTDAMEENYQPLQHIESDISRALTPQEQEMFLRVAQARQPFVYWYSLLGIDCTLGSPEERGLQLGDVSLAGRVLQVRARSAKNKYRIRTIPLTDQATWALESLIERARERGACQPQHYLMPLFLSRRKKEEVVGRYDPARPMTVSGIKKPWDDVRREASVPWFTPYGLRHTGCTRYAEAGMPIHVLLSMAGHMSRRTQEHYVHISEAAKRQMIQGMSSVGIGAKPVQRARIFQPTGAHRN